MRCDTSDAVLTVALESLRNQNGQPDVPARRRALDNLLRSLTPDEIFRLRCQISHIPTTRDPCVALPVDILLQVADFLHLEDFVNVTSVSRTWHDVWRNGKISLKFIKREFSSFFAHSYEDLDETEKKAAGERLSQWLPGAARERIARVQGHYRSRWTDDDQRFDGPRGYDARDYQQYHSRRLAQRLGDERIRVTSLLTGTSSIYVDPDREHINYWVLSDQFLLGCIGPRPGPSARVRVWSLNSDYTERVRLPSPFHDSASVYHDRVSFCKDSKFYIWQIGASLKSYDYLSKDSKALAYPALFHPVKDDHFFLPNYHWRSMAEAAGIKCVLRFTVLEYIQNMPRKEYGFDVPMDHDSDDNDSSNQDLGIIHALPKGWRTTDDGLCMFYWIHWKEAGVEPLGPTTCRYHLDQKLLEGAQGRVKIITVLTFNMHTKDFSQRHYFDVDNPEWEAHIWRDQVLFPTQKVGHWDLKAVTFCEKARGQVPVFTYFHNGARTDGRRRKEPRRESTVDYCWAGDTETDRIDFHHREHAVQGDDDFVVMFGHRGYTVYCFLRSDEFQTRRRDMIGE